MDVGWQKKIITLTAVAMAAAITLPSVWAQSASPPPTPGSVITPIDKPVVQPGITREPIITSGDEGIFTPPAYSKKIHVDQFVLTGNSLFDDEILLGEIADYIDASITLDQIYQAADRIQQFYRAQGYLLTSVYVPAQKISSGTVRLEIIEGRLEGLQLEGEFDSYRADFLLRQLDDLKLGEVITSPELEREVLLLNDLPGLSARAVILPGSEYGTSTITIVADEDRSQSTLRLNNHGRVSLGETRLEAGWLYANPFAQGDQLNLSAIVSEDARMLFVRADYDALINKSGTRVGIGASAFDYEVDTAEIGLVGDLGGEGANLRLLVTHPLVRQQRNRLDFIAVLRRDETSENGNLALSTKTQSINVLDLTLQWQPTHANGSVSSAFITFSSNFEHNTDGSKDDALNDKLTIDYRYHMLFAKTWFALLRANLVFASDPLPDVERYRLGGPSSVRAYPTAEVAGDEGELFSVDIGKRFRLSGTTLLIAKIFADSGKVTRILPNEKQFEERLAGYGAGILVDFAGKHTIEFEVVTPTTDRISSDGRDTRGWLNYAVHF